MAQRAALVLAVTSLAAGCGFAGSRSLEGVATSNVYALLWVTASGNGQSEVYAQLKPSLLAPENYSLSKDDALQATVGSTQEPMVAVDTAIRGLLYRATFATEAEGTEFQVKLTRAHDGGAPLSSATLPAPFSLTGPAAGSTFSRGEAITITWDPSGTSDTMRWRVAPDSGANCFGRESGELSGDPGTLTIPAGTLKTPSGEQPSSCAGTLEIARTREGQLDAAFSDGNFAAEQVRSIPFTSTP